MGNRQPAGGEGKTFSLPPVVTGTITDGTSITFTGTLKQSGVFQVDGSATAIVETNPVLELSLTEDLDPVATSALLSYTLTFGNRSLGIVSQNAVLSVPIPTGTSFVSATNGGVLTGGNVVWSLGNIGAGESGTRQFQVQVSSGASDGDVIKAEASLVDTSIPVNQSRASAVTRVQSAAPMSLSITVNPDPARPGETLNITLSLTNLSSTTRFNVVLKARVPDEIVDNLHQTTITEGATCSGGWCSPRDLITWDIGNLATGQNWTATMPPVVTSGTPEGTIIQFNALVFDGTDNRSDAAKSVIVSNRPDITVDDLSKSFGSITVGSSSDQTVTITNNGNADLDLNTIADSNAIDPPFSIPGEDDNCSGVTLSPTGSCNFTVRFSPTASGVFNDTFNISSNDPDEGFVNVSVNGTGLPPSEPEITVTDSVAPTDDLQVSFGSITVASDSDKTVTVTNDGSASLNIGTIVLGNTVSTPFSIQNDNCSLIGLAPTAICTFTVRFSPTASGLFDNTVEIPSNDSDESTVTLNIDGNGQVPPTPDIAVTNSVVSFGGITVGDTSDQTVTVTNEGTATLVINTVAFADDLTVPFSILNNACSGANLLPTENCTLTVKFSPTTTGTFNDTFDIPSNDPDEDPVIVSLSGTGLVPPAPEITVTDSAAPTNDLQVPFGDVTDGNTSSKTVTVTNDGNATLNIGTIAGLTAPFSIPTDNCSGTSIAPAANCTLTVLFSPASTGLFNDSFDIPSDDPDDNSVPMSVSGTGVAVLVSDITVTDSVASSTDLSISFGNVTEGNTADQTVTLTNDGNANLVIGTISSTDVILAPFSIPTDNCSGVSLAPAGSCTLTVRFSPTASGPFNDTFDIPSNDPDEDSVTFSVDGTGVSGNAAPTAPELVFPAEGETVTGPNVEFGWNRSTDSDGDTLSYTLIACEDAAFTNGCITETNIAALKNKGVDYAGLGLGFGLVFGLGLVLVGRTKGRRKMGMFMAVLVISGTLLGGCADSGGDAGTPAEPPTADITQTLTGLESGETYHWKVTADDSNGGVTDSLSRSFNVQ